MWNPRAGQFSFLLLKGPRDDSEHASVNNTHVVWTSVNDKTDCIQIAHCLQTYPSRAPTESLSHNHSEVWTQSFVGWFTSSLFAHCITIANPGSVQVSLPPAPASAAILLTPRFTRPRRWGPFLAARCSALTPDGAGVAKGTKSLKVRCQSIASCQRNVKTPPDSHDNGRWQKGATNFNNFLPF